MSPETIAVLDQVVRFLGIALLFIGTRYGAVFVRAFDRKIGLQATDAEQTALMAAVNTKAGIMETRIDQGSMVVGDIHARSPEVMKAAFDVATMVRLPTKAAISAMDIADMIVGAVDTGSRTSQPPATPKSPMEISK